MEYYPLHPGEFFEETHKKDLVVLHHTVGRSAKSSIDGWNINPVRIGTAYVVERDGTVFQTFPDDKWAFHLGLKGVPLGQVDRRSIGIEIASEGGLLLSAGSYYAFGSITPKNKFLGEVWDAGVPWRDWRYFAMYTPQAVASVFDLVRSLMDQYHIPKQVPTNPGAASLASYVNFRGVLSHSHLRADKSDVHPGFPWSQLASTCGLMMV